MIMWIFRVLIGCKHTYEPYGQKVKVYRGEEANNMWRMEESHRCSKCGHIRIFRIG